MMQKKWSLSGVRFASLIGCSRRMVKRRSQLEVFHPPMMATISGRGAQVIGLSSRTPPPKRPTVHVRIPKNGMTYRLDIQVIEEVIGSCTERS